MSQKTEGEQKAATQASGGQEATEQKSGGRSRVCAGRNVKYAGKVIKAGEYLPKDVSAEITKKLLRSGAIENY